MSTAGVTAHCAAIVTFSVVMAARPVSADPRTIERSRFECGTSRVGYPSLDPLRRPALRSARHRAIVGIPRSRHGGLAHPIVKRFIAKHDDKLARCYPRRLPASTGAGQIGLSFVILPTGTVQLLGALGFDAEVTSCMAKIVETIQFPRSPAGDVTHTFVPITIVEGPR